MLGYKEYVLAVFFFSPGGRFGELLDQEVSCSVVGGEVAIPEPADTLDGCKAGDQPLLDPLVVENLKKMKCRWLLPIQRYAIPIVGRGHDLLGCAATGCGKTLAFLAPLVSKVISCAGLFRPHFPGSHAQVREHELYLHPYHCILWDCICLVFFRHSVAKDFSRASSACCIVTH